MQVVDVTGVVVVLFLVGWVGMFAPCLPLPESKQNGEILFD